MSAWVSPISPETESIVHFLLALLHVSQQLGWMCHRGWSTECNQTNWCHTLWYLRLGSHVHYELTISGLCQMLFTLCDLHQYWWIIFWCLHILTYFYGFCVIYRSGCSLMCSMFIIVCSVIFWLKLYCEGCRHLVPCSKAASLPWKEDFKSYSRIFSFFSALLYRQTIWKHFIDLHTEIKTNTHSICLFHEVCSPEMLDWNQIGAAFANTGLCQVSRVRRVKFATQDEATRGDHYH